MKTIVMTGVVTALVLAFVAAAVSVSVSGGGASATASGASGPFKATVSLNVGGKGVTGDLTLTQENPSAPVVIKGTIMGLSEGKHGFHVHEKGNVTGGCASTGGHFNPHGKKHGAPEDMERHAGDLGNIEADATGKAVIDISDKMISLESGSNIGIIGRAIVVHEGTDDLGKGGDTGSETTGNAGGRAGCGVIAKEGGDGDGTGPVIEGSGTEGSTVDPKEKVEGDNSGANFGQQFQTPMIYLIILIMKFIF